MNVKWKELTAKQRSIVLNGSPEPHEYTIKSSSGNIVFRTGYIEGIKTKLSDSTKKQRVNLCVTTTRSSFKTLFVLPVTELDLTKKLFR